MTADDHPRRHRARRTRPPGRDARAGLVVALDGPASSGKSSVGAAAALDLGYRFCDTGLLYRALTELALRRGVGPRRPGRARRRWSTRSSSRRTRDGRLARVLVDGVDVTDEVRRPEVDRRSARSPASPRSGPPCSPGSARSPRRAGSSWPGATSGRSCCPTPTSRSYLDASVEERARRRAEERGLDPDHPRRTAILADLRRRDDLDRNRPVAPLAAAGRRGPHRDRRQHVRRRPWRRVEAVIRAARAGARTRWLTRRPSARRLEDRISWFIRATDTLRALHLAVLRPTSRRTGLDRLRGLDGPVLLVANHVSNADAPLIGSFVTPALGRRIYWLGKQEALDWPVLGALIEHNAVIGIQRGAADVEAFRAARRVLDEGHVLIVFPEGTRSPTGALQEAKEGTTILALRTGAPILPIGVAGTRPRSGRAASGCPIRAGAGSSCGSASRSRSARRDRAPSDERPRSPPRTRSWAGSRRCCRPPSAERTPPRPRPRTRRRRGYRRIPCDNRADGHRSRRQDRAAHRLLLRRARGDRQGQGGRRRRARRPTPSARSSTTRA